MCRRVTAHAVAWPGLPSKLLARWAQDTHMLSWTQLSAEGVLLKLLQDLRTRDLISAPLLIMPSTAFRCLVPSPALELTIKCRASRDRSATDPPLPQDWRIERLVLLSRYSQSSCTTCANVNWHRAHVQPAGLLG